jgi:hypothetical protein
VAEYVDYYVDAKLQIISGTSKTKRKKRENEFGMIVISGCHGSWFIYSKNGIMTPFGEAKFVNALNCQKKVDSCIILAPKFRDELINILMSSANYYCNQ